MGGQARSSARAAQVCDVVEWGNDSFGSCACKSHIDIELGLFQKGKGVPR